MALQVSGGGMGEEKGGAVGDHLLGELGEGAQCLGARVEGGRRCWSARAHPPPLSSETVDQAVETYGLQKITLLREISLKTGIQVGWVWSVLQGPQGLG